MSFTRIVLFCLALVLPLVSEKVQAQPQADLLQKLEMLNAYPDLIVVNARVYTMDAALTEAGGMAVKNRRILKLGTTDEIRFLAGPKTEVLDAKGRTVLPGLIDSHTLPNFWGVEHWFGGEGDAAVKRYSDPQLKIVPALGNNSMEVLKSVEQAIRNREQELGPEKWILVKVFGGKTIGESRKIATPLFASRKTAGTINTQYLDAVAPNNPVMLYATEAIGPTASNTKAQEQMRQIPGYEAEGIFARTVVPFEVLLRGRRDAMADLLKREILECLSAQGITPFGDRFDRSPAVIQAYNLLYQRGDMPIRYGYYSDGGANTTEKFKNPNYNPILIRMLNQEVGNFLGIGNDYIWSAGIANEGWDGELVCTKAKPLPSAASLGTSKELGAEGLRPDCSVPIEYDKQIGYQSVLASLQNVLRIGSMHSYSDGAYDALFHMLDQAVSEGKLTVEQIRALRISTEHNPIIRPDQVGKFAMYNFRPGFNGYQIQGDIKGGAFLKSYGEQYMNWMVPVKSLVNAGVHAVFNTGAHLGKNIPYYFKDMDYPTQWDGNIWAFMVFVATRVMPNNGVTYNKKEALDKVSLLRAAAIGGAEELMNEKNIGSLEIGKLADFIVIDKDYFAVPDNQIHTIKPVLTVLGGKITYRSTNY